MHCAEMAGLFYGAGADVQLDLRLLAVPANWQVHVYALEPVRKLIVLRQHVSAVIAACFTSSNQLVTASVDGCVATWDIDTWKVTGTCNVGAAVSSLVVPSGGDLAHVAMQPHQSGIRIRFLKMSSGVLLHSGIKLSSVGPLTVSGDGRAVATWDNRRVLMWSASQTDGIAVKPLVVHLTKAVTCVALTSSADKLAVGDASGRISVWANCVEGMAAAAAATAAKDGSSQEGSSCMAPPHSVHWHSRAVLALSFSLDSLRLLSGGHESVLVTWELASNAKSFLSGMSSSITRIMPSQQHASSYITTHADNSLWLADTSISTLADIDVGLLPHISHNGHLAPFHRPGHPGQLIVTSALGRFQVFDAAQGKNIAQVQVSPNNWVGDRSSRAGFSIRHVAVSGDGLSVIVVERPQAARQGPALESTEYVDTWVYNSAMSCFQLLTSVPSPIRAPIRSLLHHPHLIQLAVGGCDGSLVICVPSPSDYMWQRSRVLRSSGTEVGCLAFSGDGSLLAAGTRCEVLLYDIDSGTLRTTLPQAAADTASSPRQLSFSPCGLLIAVHQRSATEVRLTAWNLLTSRVQWAVTTVAQCVAFSSTSSHIAISARCTTDDESDASESRERTAPGDVGSFDGLIQLDAATGQVVGSWLAATESMKGIVYNGAHAASADPQEKPPIVSFSRAGVCHDWQSDLSAVSPPVADMVVESSNTENVLFNQRQAQPQDSTPGALHKPPGVALPGIGRQSHALQPVLNSTRDLLLELARST